MKQRKWTVDEKLAIVMEGLYRSVLGVSAGRGVAGAQGEDPDQSEEDSEGEERA